jgi:hypothetical protein
MVRFFEYRTLRITFVPKRQGVTGEWRQLNNGELNEIYLT